MVTYVSPDLCFLGYSQVVGMHMWIWSNYKLVTTLVYWRLAPQVLTPDTTPPVCWTGRNCLNKKIIIRCLHIVYNNIIWCLHTVYIIYVLSFYVPSCHVIIMMLILVSEFRAAVYWHVINRWNHYTFLIYIINANFIKCRNTSNIYNKMRMK
jgi:hypothetical protein